MVGQALHRVMRSVDAAFREATAIRSDCPPADRFWWTAAAFGFLVAGHAVYWLVTHPVNNFWVRDIDMSGAGAAFFSLLSAKDGAGDWTQMRAIWEYSHVVRASLAMACLVSMAIALTL